MTSTELATRLEELVDATNAESVLEALSTVFAEKAEHIQSNWQDSGLALSYRKLADAVDRARRVANKQLS